MQQSPAISRLVMKTIHNVLNPASVTPDSNSSVPSVSAMGVTKVSRKLCFGESAALSITAMVHGLRRSCVRAPRYENDIKERTSELIFGGGGGVPLKFGGVSS